MRASLPMYALPGLEAATEALWAGLAAAFRAEGLAEVPERLSWEADHAALWTAPDLFFSQTCGYPLTHQLAGRVTLVATPLYDCPGCVGGSYRSEILVRADAPGAGLADFAGRRAAVNAADSQSGCHALRHAVRDLVEDGRFFASVVVTGRHRASMQAVAAGDADLCAIDGVTLALLRQTEPDLVARLRVLASSASAPALPYITRRDIGDDDLQRLRAGLARACGDPALVAVRQELLLAGVAVLPLSAYDRIPAMESAAAAAGCLVLV